MDDQNADNHQSTLGYEGYCFKQINSFYNRESWPIKSINKHYTLERSYNKIHIVNPCGGEKKLPLKHVEQVKLLSYSPSLFANRPNFQNPGFLMHSGDLAIDSRVSNDSAIAKIISTQPLIYNGNLPFTRVARCSLSSPTTSERKLFSVGDPNFSINNPYVHTVRPASIKVPPGILDMHTPYTSIDGISNNKSLPEVRRIIISGSDLPNRHPVRKDLMSFDDYWKSVSIEKNKIIIPILKKSPNLGFNKQDIIVDPSIKPRFKCIKFDTKDVMFLYDPEE